MSKTLHITIDGKPCTCEKGEFLLDVAKRNSVFIPTLCFHEGLGGLGACRLCIVEVVEQKRSRVVVSCVYPVEREIEVFTQTEKIKEQRGVILALLHHLAPQAKVISDMAKFMGVDLPRLIDKPDGDKCVLCGRCTTACELVGSGAIAKVNRGITKKIDTPYDAPSAECIGCASCAHVCPTGAIAFEESETTVSIWGRTFDLRRCTHCGRPISTDELIANARHKIEAGTTIAGSEPEELVCADCKKALVAAKMKEGFKL
jgi:NADH dehydrogenase/NADH:ubiquinone oxidoreductase subunit G